MDKYTKEKLYLHQTIMINTRTAILSIFCLPGPKTNLTYTTRCADFFQSGGLPGIQPLKRSPSSNLIPSTSNLFSRLERNRNIWLNSIPGTSNNVSFLQVDKILKAGVFLPLRGFDKQGRYVLIVRSGQVELFLSLNIWVCQIMIIILFLAVVSESRFFNFETRMRVSPFQSRSSRRDREFLTLTLRLRDETEKKFPLISGI